MTDEELIEHIHNKCKQAELLIYEAAILADKLRASYFVEVEGYAIFNVAKLDD